MIAVDTSSLSAFLAGEAGPDVDVVEDALRDTRMVLPPVVLTEVLSSRSLRAADAAVLAQIPLIPLHAGFWERSGTLRASVLRKGHKSRLADVLIAQSCIDESIALVTRDRDFRHYVSAGLRILP